MEYGALIEILKRKSFIFNVFQDCIILHLHLLNFLEYIALKKSSF